MAYIDMLELRRNALQVKVQEIKRKVGQLPEGELRCINNHGYVQWFNIGGNEERSRVYIPKGDGKFAEQLAMRGFLESQLRDVLYEIEIIDAFLIKYGKVNPMPGSNYLERNDEYKRLLNSHLGEVPAEVKEFLSMQYVSNAHQENLKFTTKSGLKVRSKTENEIADMLDYYKLPYLYEVPYSFVKNGWTKTVALDFTIMNPMTFQRVGWTHMGRMDDPQYVSKNETHIADLTRLNFIPGENLIVTFESKNHLISSAEIEAQILAFFPGVEGWRW